MSALLVGLIWGGIWHLYADYFALGDRGRWAVGLLVVQAPLLLTAHSVLLMLRFGSPAQSEGRCTCKAG